MVWSMGRAALAGWIGTRGRGLLRSDDCQTQDKCADHSGDNRRRNESTRKPPEPFRPWTATGSRCHGSVQRAGAEIPAQSPPARRWGFSARYAGCTISAAKMLGEVRELGLPAFFKIVCGALLTRPGWV